VNNANNLGLDFWVLKDLMVNQGMSLGQAKKAAKSMEAPKPVTSTRAKPVISTRAKPVISTHARPVISTHAKPVTSTRAKPATSTHAKPVTGTKSTDS
jgi:hypothetical protein